MAQKFPTPSFSILLTLLSFLIGCDKASTNSPPTTSATTAPASAATAPTSQPTTELMIDGKPVQFPSPKLVITRQANGLNAILCTDDPPAAIESTYRGNSFMFEMKLDAQAPDDLPSLPWDFKSANTRPRDTTTGIFLDGARRQLQPADAKITFEKRADRMIATIAGKFLLFDVHDASMPVQTVQVNGALNAAVQEQN